MPYKAYWASALIGGTTGCLDKIDGADLADKDIAIVGDSTTTAYIYWLDDDSGASESSPSIISPDTNAGNKRWLLLGLIASGITLVDGSSLSLQEDITFTGATTVNQIKMPNNLADALSILQGANKYVTFITTTDLEDIIFYKSVDILHTAVGAGEHALEIDADAANYGDIKAIDIDYITGTIATGQDEGIILINIDQSQATGGDIFALEVLATEADGVGVTGVYGLKAGALVGPVHQNSGTFDDMASALVNDVDKLTAFITSDPGGDPGTNNVEIFSANNDTVTIGDAAKFEELEFLLETVASGGGIKPTFEFSTGEGAWTSFTPVDGTDGMRHSGIIAWDDADISTWAVDNTPEYLIRIKRTRGGSLTPPVEDKVQIAAVTKYVWDENGDVSIRGLTLAGNLALGANSITGTSVDISNAELQLLSAITSAGGSMIAAANAAAQRSLLNVEDGSTADQTGSEIATAISGETVTALTITTLTSDSVDGVDVSALATAYTNHAAAANPHSGHALESVLGTSIGTGLLLDTAVLKASTVLQVYHGINPAANVQSLLGAANYAAIMALLSATAGATFDWNDQQISNIKSIAFNDGGATVTQVKDEDDMAADSATMLATQQSIKKYVDTATAGASGFVGGLLLGGM